MSNRFESREVGDTIRFESELFSSLPFDSTENLTDADSIEISIEKRDGTKVVDSETPSEHSKGQYYYEWDTSGLNPEQFRVVVEVDQGDAEEKTTGFIQLTRN